MNFQQWALRNWLPHDRRKGKYNQLDPSMIMLTLDLLSKRIGERFPESGLFGVSKELADLGREGKKTLHHLERPIWPLRLLVVGVIIGLVSLIIYLIVMLIEDLSTTVDGWSDFLQGSEAAINELIFLAIAIFFLGGLEMRYKRWIALRSLHSLRSLAHVVDMHQLTKDPAIILASQHRPTQSSPERPMTPYELTRYLEYCSELLALNSKLAALHVQYLDDPVVLNAVNDLESLAQGLSNKIWQKIMILDLATPTPDPLISPKPTAP
jgi:hypothetical protein